MKEAVKCPNCGSLIGEESIYCTKCGAHRPAAAQNRCENPDCLRHKRGFEFDSEDMYCDLCGQPTTLGKKVESNC